MPKRIYIHTTEVMSLMGVSQNTALKRIRCVKESLEKEYITYHDFFTYYRITDIDIKLAFGKAFFEKYSEARFKRF